MKQYFFIGMCIFIAGSAIAQDKAPEKPVKTGNEWKMPGDVFKRSKDYSSNLQKSLGLDSIQTRKVYEAYLANTKPLDEISIQKKSQKEKDILLKANKAAFNEKLKGIFSSAQYDKYLKMDIAKN